MQNGILKNRIDGFSSTLRSFQTSSIFLGGTPEILADSIILRNALGLPRKRASHRSKKSEFPSKMNFV
jgi:hypothetical protein